MLKAIMHGRGGGKGFTSPKPTAMYLLIPVRCVVVVLFFELSKLKVEIFFLAMGCRRFVGGGITS